MHTKGILLGAILSAIILNCQCRADGPHWYIPEPPESPPLLMEGDPTTMQRYATAMGIYTRAAIRGPNAVAKPNRSSLEQICHICIRYLREYHQYAAAPDSPQQWKTQTGREKMAEYAFETLVILSEYSAPLLAQAYVDQIRFMSAAQTKKLSETMKKYMDVQAKLVKLYDLIEGDDAEEGNASNANRTFVSMFQDPKVYAEWSRLSSEASKLRYQGGFQLPKSFQNNTTGDIPILNQESDTRLIEAIRRTGIVAINPLKKFSGHANPTVRKAVSQMLGVLEHQWKKPETLLCNLPHIKKELRKLKNHQAREFRPALDRLEKLGKKAWPILLSIAKDKDSRQAREALGALQFITRHNYKGDLSKWETYINRVVPQTASKPKLKGSEK